MTAPGTAIVNSSVLSRVNPTPPRARVVRLARLAPRADELAKRDDLAEVVGAVDGEAAEHVRHRRAGVGLVRKPLGRRGPPESLLDAGRELGDERRPLVGARGLGLRVDAPRLPLRVER